MKKKFLSNLLLLVIINILIKPFWFFGIEVAVQNRVGEEMYGFYFSLFNFAFILNILLDIGITNFNNRAVSRDHSLLPLHLSNIVPLKFLLSIIYGLVVFVAGAIIGYSSLHFKLLAVLVINQFLSSFILYMRSNISGIQLFRTDSLLSVLDRSLMIIITGILLWTNISREPFKIEWFVYTQTASYTLTLFTVVAVVLYHSGKIHLKFKFSGYKNILRQSYPFAILILLMSFFNRADSVMIERLLPDGKEQAGIYAQSFRVLDALSQFAVLFAALLLPMFSKMLKTGENTEDLINISSSLLLGVAITAAVAAVFFNNEIITLMYHKAVLNSPAIFSILMCGFVFISVSYIFGTLLTANRNLKQLNILAGLTVVVNIGLNLLLIPAYKAYGAAIASISSQGFYAIGQIIVAHKMIRLNLNYSFYGKLLLFGIFITVAAWLLSKYLSWVPAIILFVAISVILSILTGIIRPREILAIFRED
ncbi:MAG: polysaccharide biosynthesis C-terminal domain-containing protein [Bacteroidales bacterium]